MTPRTREAQVSMPAPHVRWAATLYFASVPFDPFVVVAGRTAPSLVGLVFIGLWVVDVVLARRVIRGWVPLTGIVYLTLTWALVTLVAAPYAPSIVPAASLALSMLICLALVDVSGQSIRAPLMALCSGAAILSGLLLAIPSTENYGRTTLGVADENEIAFQLSLGFAAAVWLYFKAAWPAAISLPTSALLITGILLTGSRTGMAAAAGIVGSAILWAVLSKSVARVKVLMISVGAVVGSGVALAYGLVTDRVIRLFTGQDGFVDPSRRRIERAYLETSDDWWLFGVGYGADAHYLSHAGGPFLHAHGLAFKAWVELGFVGLLLVAALLTAALYAAHRSSQSLPIVVFMAPVLVFAYTLSGLNLAGFWIVIAIAVAPYAAQRGDSAVAPTQSRSFLCLGQ